MPKPPVDSEEFCRVTALSVPGIACHILNQHATLTESDKKWFVCYCDTRLRYLYANNYDWREKLRSENSRVHAFRFVERELAQIEDIKQFQKRNNLTRFGVTDEIINETKLY